MFVLICKHGTTKGINYLWQPASSEVLHTYCEMKLCCWYNGDVVKEQFGNVMLVGDSLQFFGRASDPLPALGVRATIKHVFL